MVSNYTNLNNLHSTWSCVLYLINHHDYHIISQNEYLAADPHYNTSCFEWVGEKYFVSLKPEYQIVGRAALTTTHLSVAGSSQNETEWLINWQFKIQIYSWHVSEVWKTTDTITWPRSTGSPWLPGHIQEWIFSQLCNRDEWGFRVVPCAMKIALDLPCW